MSERALFLGALDREDPEERTAFLQQACGGDASLRQRIEALLKSHAEAGPFFLQHPILRLAFPEREGLFEPSAGDAGAGSDLDVAPPLPRLGRS